MTAKLIDVCNWNVVGAVDKIFTSGRADSMQNWRKRMQAVIVLTVFLAAGLYAPLVSASDCDPQSQKEQGLMVMDAALARPVGAVATVAGFAVFLVSSPFSALGGNTQEAWDSLVAAPATYTFKRPLGHFDCEPPVNPTER